jgi:hypothetical protein
MASRTPTGAGAQLAGANLRKNGVTTMLDARLARFTLRWALPTLGLLFTAAACSSSPDERAGATDSEIIKAGTAIPTGGACAPGYVFQCTGYTTPNGCVGPHVCVAQPGALPPPSKQTGCGYAETNDACCLGVSTPTLKCFTGTCGPNGHCQPCGATAGGLACCSDGASCTCTGAFLTPVGGNCVSCGQQGIAACPSGPACAPGLYADQSNTCRSCSGVTATITSFVPSSPNDAGPWQFSVAYNVTPAVPLVATLENMGTSATYPPDPQFTQWSNSGDITFSSVPSTGPSTFQVTLFPQGAPSCTLATSVAVLH